MCLVTIPGYPGYLISKSGDIFSKTSERKLSIKIADNKYPMVYGLTKDNRGGVSLHRLLALAFIPNPDNLPEVNHIDGNKSNFSLVNLEWVSESENIRHAFSTGLAKNKNCIPYEDIPKIITELLTSKTWSDLARDYDVSDPSTIRKLLKRDFERKGNSDGWMSLASIVKTRANNLCKKEVKAICKDDSEESYESLHAAALAMKCAVPSIFKAIKSRKIFKERSWVYA